jgi:hypothetical protein
MISSDSRVERVMARGESLICLGTRGVTLLRARVSVVPSSQFENQLLKYPPFN